MVGMKPVIDQLLGVRDALANPLKWGTLLNFGGKRLGAQLRLTTPEVPVGHAELRPAAQDLAKRLREFGLAVQSALFKHRESIVDRQFVLERLSDAACELYASGCTLSRLEHLLGEANGNAAQRRRELLAGQYYLRLADRRVRQSLDALTDNDDALTTATADAALEPLGG
jgi:hypothetical protein